MSKPKEPDKDFQTLYSYICPFCGAVYMRQYEKKQQCVDCGKRFPEKMSVETTSKYKNDNTVSKSEDRRK